MDKNMDFSGFSPYPPFDNGFEQNMGDMPFNPMMQYEQGYVYYRFLCKQMEYKIKCKEYEKLCGNKSENRRVE